MAIALVNSNFPEAAAKAIELDGINVIPLPLWDCLEMPMSTHPDMMIFMGFGHIVCHKDYYNKYTALIDSIVAKASLLLVVSDEEIDRTYPRDAKFNACVVGNSVICNTKHISRHILDIAKENNANIIHVNQGYTKCSTLVVGDNEIITSDRGIYMSAQNAGVNSLLISAGNVMLKPYEYGFIGGASGMYDNKIYFCGNLENHPDKEKICEFITLCGKECVFLPFPELTDIGSILFVE